MGIQGALVVAVVSVAALSQSSVRVQWQLPVSLDQAKTDVRRVLGPPNETIPGSLRAVSPEAAADFIRSRPGQSLEYYYSSGLVGRYSSDRLFGITILARADYPGWIQRSGPIIGGVLVTDRREAVLRKLGPPSKVEDDSLDGKANVDEPVVFPAESRY